MTAHGRSRHRAARRACAFLILLLVLASVGLPVAPVEAAAPVIVNGAGTNWLESLAVPQDSAGERITVTVVVKHDAGRVVRALAVDDNWDGADDTPSSSTWRSVF